MLAIKKKKIDKSGDIKVYNKYIIHPLGTHNLLDTLKIYPSSDE